MARIYGGSGGAAAAAVNVQVDNLATDVELTAPIFNTVLSGTFVPATTEMEARVSLTSWHYGLAWATLRLLYGNVTPTGSLQEAGRYNPPKAGVTNVKIGKVGLDGTQGSVFRTVRMTGLTAGATYSYRLQMAVVGGLQTLDLPAGLDPQQIVLVDDADPPTFNSMHKAYIRLYNVGDVLVINPQPMTKGAWWNERAYDLEECAKYRIGGMGAADGGSCGAPNGGRVFFTSFWSNAVYIIDTATDVIERTVTVTGPVSVAAESDTLIWAGRDGQLVSIVPSTGASGPIATITTEALATPWGLAIDRTNRIAYLACDTPTKLIRVNLATGAVTHNVAIAAPGRAIALSPDNNTVWVGMTGANPVKGYNASDLTAISGAELALQGGGTPAVTGITVNSTNTVAYVTRDNGRWDYYYIGTGDGVQYNWYDGLDLGVGAHGVTVSQMENIWTSMSNLAGTLASEIYIWPGCEFIVRAATGGEFWHEHCQIEWRGVQ